MDVEDSYSRPSPKVIKPHSLTPFVYFKLRQCSSKPTHTSTNPQILIIKLYSPSLLQNEKN